MHSIRISYTTKIGKRKDFFWNVTKLQTNLAIGSNDPRLAAEIFAAAA